MFARARPPGLRKQNCEAQLVSKMLCSKRWIIEDYRVHVDVLLKFLKHIRAAQLSATGGFLFAEMMRVINSPLICIVHIVRRRKGRSVCSVELAPFATCTVGFKHTCQHTS